MAEAKGMTAGRIALRILGLFGIAIFAFVMIVLALLNYLVHGFPWSAQRCAEKVASQEAAMHAIAAFFTSDQTAAKRLIGELRGDGLTDEYLRRLQAGCPGCYIRRGDRQNEDPALWYVITSIAPPDAKRTVILEIECSAAVWLNERLYGG